MSPRSMPLRFMGLPSLAQHGRNEKRYGAYTHKWREVSYRLNHSLIIGLVGYYNAAGAYGFGHWKTPISHHRCMYVCGLFYSNATDTCVTLAAGHTQDFFRLTTKPDVL